jgi:hypothetical protein
VRAFYLVRRSALGYKVLFRAASREDSLKRGSRRSGDRVNIPVRGGVGAIVIGGVLLLVGKKG